MINDPKSLAELAKIEDEMVGASFVIMMFIILAVAGIFALGLWSQAIALGVGVWIGKRSKGAK